MSSNNLIIEYDYFGWNKFLEENIINNEKLILNTKDKRKFLKNLCKNFINQNNLYEKCKSFNNNNNNGKDSIKSTMYRQKGNEKYLNEQWMDCLQLYSMSLLYANECDSTLSLAYGNRSAVNFQLKNFEKSLMDIEMAISTGYNRYKCEKKLRKRQIDCLLRLNKMNEAKLISNQYNIEIDDSLNNNFDNKNSDEKIAKNFINGKYSDKCKIKYLENFGRSICCQNDIEKNEIILIEYPFVNVLLSFCEQKYCHNCCRKININDKQQFDVCHYCNNVIYCNSECQQNSWNKYHQYECQLLPFLWQFGIGHLNYRLMSMLDVDLIVNTYQISNKIDDIEIFKKLNDIDDDNLINERRYQSLYSLQTHENDNNSINLMAYRLTSELIIELLIRMGKYDDNLDENIKNILIDVCFRHLCQTIINSHTITDYDSTAIATGFYSSLSLLNHSCDPNISVKYCDGNKCIVSANRLIKSNEQIFFCYNVYCNNDNGDDLNFKQRKKLLFDQYYFDCQCNICCKIQTE